MIRRSTSELSIKPKLSLKMRLAIILVAFLVLVAATYYTYQAGVADGHTQVDQDQALISQLNSTVVSLRGEFKKSQENMTIAQRHRQIQEEAYEQINAAYASSEKKNSYLSSRLDFYRSIISPEDGKVGPSIQALNATQKNGVLNFSVTLVQAIKHKQQIWGSLQVSMVAGRETISVWPEAGPRSVNFQYFQEITGSISSANLPENGKLIAILTLRSGEVIERELALKDLPVPNSTALN